MISNLILPWNALFIEIAVSRSDESGWLLRLNWEKKQEKVDMVLINLRWQTLEWKQTLL